MGALLSMPGKRSAARSAERAALAEAIATRNEAARLLDGIRNQESEAEQSYFAAVSKRDAAASVATGAAAAYGAHLVNVQAGAVEDAPITPQRARANLAEAEDNLETARAVREGVKARGREQEARLQSAETRVSREASAVLAQSPAICATVAAFDRAQADLLRLGISLQWLTENGFVSAVPWTLAARDREAGKTAPKPVIERTLLDRLQSPPLTWRALLDGPGGIQANAAAAWKAALAALEQDADAPLPTVREPLSAA